MIQNVFKQVFASAGSQTGYMNLQDCNGLIVASTVAPSQSDYLTVVLKSELHEPIVLVNRINLAVLSEINNIESGTGYRLQKEVLDIVGTTNPAAFPFYAFAVDLGCVKMRSSNSTLEITVEASAAQTMSISAYFDANDSDKLYRYVESRQLSDRQAGVDRLYLYSTSAPISAVASEDISVQVSHAHGTAVCNGLDLYGYTAARGQVEGFAQVAACAFKSSDELVDAAEWTINGSSSGNYRTVARTVTRHNARVSKGTIAEVHRAISVLQKKSPEEVQAFKRSGIVPSISDLQAAAGRYNVPRGNA